MDINAALHYGDWVVSPQLSALLQQNGSITHKLIGEFNDCEDFDKRSTENYPKFM